MAGKHHIVSMPSQAVHDVWHEFILFTRNDKTFYQRALGQEGINPKHPQHLPLLFSIDHDLRIANDFYYVPDCSSQIRHSGATGTVYCGSHAGCNSGCGGSSDSGGDGGGCGAAGIELFP